MSDADDFEELLGAYAIDAVDDDEREMIERYLATHPRARAEVADHQAVATFLAFSGERAPAGLWDRIAAGLEGEAPAPGQELAKILPMAPAEPKRSRRVAVALGALAAAAAAVIVALGIVVVNQRDDLEDREVALEAGYEDALDAAGSRTVTISSEDGTVNLDAVVTAEGQGFLRAESLPALGPDESYQLWAIEGDNAPVSLGVLGPEPGTVAFTTTAGSPAVLAVSSEGRGGAVAPTTVVAAGELA